ncbi:hypothetical protein KAR91_12725 [Candidatus Pacearchaeota archaeon]|nr:hypothetical protein [Candidatus Pacearchaeota archaeon]
MIRIHTGGCPECGSPIFVEYDPDTLGDGTAPIYFFGGEEFHGEIGAVIHSCECVVKAEPETEE